MSEPSPAPPRLLPHGHKATLFAMGVLVAILVLAALLGLADLGELRAAAASVRWNLVAVATAAALLSYAGIAASERAMLLVLGIRVPVRTMLSSVMVAVAVNRNLRSGGASGLAVLAWLLGRVGVPASAVVAVTVGHLVLTNALLAGAFAAGIGALVSGASDSGEGGSQLVLAYVAAGAAFLATLVGTLVVLLVPRLRAACATLCERVATWAGRVARKPAWGPRAGAFVSVAMASAAKFVVPQRGMASAWAWAATRVAASVACLWLCLAAAGVHVNLVVVLLAFAAGKSAAILSFVPAGLGVVEASTAGLLAALGHSYEAALLATLLHRAAYHVVPTLVALALLRSALASVDRSPAAASDER